MSEILNQANKSKKRTFKFLVENYDIFVGGC